MENIDLNQVVGWRSMGGSSTFGFYRDNQYENGYSSITKLSNGFADIEPYTIDKNGKPVSSNILDRVYTPNTDMSDYDFREALMVCYLVMDKVRLRVHHRSTRITAETITGFTFMEGYSERIVDGERSYMLPNGDILTDAEVLTIKSLNPYNVTDGFSASKAVRRWTRLDDYLADYQKGFFENGAVPAGQMIITARTASEFNDIVDVLQAKHKGASKNNNITYTHRPTDANGQPQNSQIEWVPFSTVNKDLGLKELFEQVNKKIDSGYGVPASIRAVNDNNTYASVRVDELIFVKYALGPTAKKIWSKFNHELNRITGGTGVALSYELEMPKIADEEKVESESKQIDAQIVSTLTAEGYTLDSAIDYVKTGLIETLKLGQAPTKEEPDILSPDEQRDTPDQPIDIYSKSLKATVSKMPLPIMEGCTRCICCEGLGEHYDTGYECYRCDAGGSVTTQEALEPVPCGGRKDSPELWIDEDGIYRHIEEKKSAKKKQLTDIDRKKYESEIEQKVSARMEKQINNVIENFGDVSKAISFNDPLDSSENKELSDDLSGTLFTLVAEHGPVEHERNTKIVLEADISTEDIKPFEMTPVQRDQYKAYLDKVATGYNAETAEKIRDVIRNSREQGASVAEIKDGLNRLIDQKYRVTRLAVSEVNRGGNEASLMSMKNIVRDTGVRVEKEWVHDGSDSPCEFCAAMIGTRVPVADDFLAMNDVLIGTDGGQFINNFVAVQVAELHPNGHCRQVYRVVKNYISDHQKAKESELAAKLKKAEAEKKKLSKKLDGVTEYSKSLESIIDGQA
jgi:hypothetical protein